MKCTRTVDAGAYVLGALAPTERSAYERHMAGCVDCRAEVADLAVLPGLLGRLDADTAVATLAPPVKAPPELLAATLRAATAERLRFRRRRHWQLAGTGLAAACLAVLLGLGGAAMVGTPQASGPAVMAQMAPAREGVPIVALVAYSPAKGGGTELKMLCLYEDSTPSDAPWMVQGVIYPRGGGEPDRTRVWSVGPDGSAKTFTASTRLAPGEIDRIELVKADGTTLLTYRPA
jgi:anti-sigma-K factor RskA